MYECLILIDPESDITVDALAEALGRFYAKTDFDPPELVVSDDRLDIRFSDYAFRVDRWAAPSVLEESREIAEDLPEDFEARERIAMCHTRLELSGQPDPDMDFFNDYLFINEVAAELATVYSFDPASGEFL